MFEITPEILQSGHKYRKELLAVPRVKLESILAFMTPRYGIQGKESVGTLKSNARLRPYKFAKNAKDTSSMDLRTLETFLGDVVEEFDRNVLWGSLWGSDLIQDTDSPGDVALKLAMYMADSATEGIASSLWVAKRNANGETTNDLFDGFETIIGQEITAGEISAAKKNLYAFDEELNEASIVKELQDFYYSSHETLQDVNTMLYLPRNMYNAYTRGYVGEFGAVAYNQSYKKTYLEGTDDKCTLVPMTGMSGKNLILSTKNNMLVGMDQRGTKETVEIRRPDNPKALQFYMLAYLGCQLESIDERNLFVGQLKTVTE